jgi:hypothetical protein
VEAEDKLLLNEINILRVARAARFFKIVLDVRDQPLNRNNRRQSTAFGAAPEGLMLSRDHRLIKSVRADHVMM